MSTDINNSHCNNLRGQEVSDWQVDSQWELANGSGTGGPDCTCSITVTHDIWTDEYGHYELRTIMHGWYMNSRPRQGWTCRARYAGEDRTGQVRTPHLYTYLPGIQYTRPCTHAIIQCHNKLLLLQINKNGKKGVSDWSSSYIIIYPTAIVMNCHVSMHLPPSSQMNWLSPSRDRGWWPFTLTICMLAK